MSRHDPLVCLRHMLDHAREAGEMARGRARSDLDTDRQLQLSLVHLLEIVGEAAARVPPDERIRFQRIQWRDIVDLRNRLIHGYDLVDLDVVWAIVQQDVPALIVELERIVAPT
ncbi:MAG: DUF86 domain-containing protein [Candidatus Brocadiae bacterium]|nr:DUF86 domain-containing protein [Candidatus Brocadiia bacterium]